MSRVGIASLLTSLALPLCFGELLPPQLMVGSRYHELIESADSIVSMKETSMEVLGLLRNFPHACSNVIQQVRKGGKGRKRDRQTDIQTDRDRDVLILSCRLSHHLGDAYIARPRVGILWRQRLLSAEHSTI